MGLEIRLFIAVDTGVCIALDMGWSMRYGAGTQRATGPKYGVGLSVGIDKYLGWRLSCEGACG